MEMLLDYNCDHQDKPFPTFNSNLCTCPLKKVEKLALPQEKLAMMLQMLERQKIEEVREQKVLNCEAMVPNEIKDQTRQPTEPMMPPLKSIKLINHFLYFLDLKTFRTQNVDIL